MNYGPYIVSWKLYKRIEEAIEQGATSDLEVWIYIQSFGINYPDEKVIFKEAAPKAKAGD